MKPIERRLAELEARLAQLRPKPVPDLPEALAWIAYTTNDELDALEELATLLAADGREMTETEERACLTIEAAALSRQLAGWGDHLADRERYLSADQSLGQALRDALPPTPSLRDLF